MTKLPIPTSTTRCSSNVASRPRTTRCADYRLHRRHAPAMQHLVHVRLAVRTSNNIDIPPVNLAYFKNRDIDLPTTTNISYSHRTSRCLSTTLTNASYSHRTSSCLSTTSTIPATDINHLADDTSNYPRTYIIICNLNK